MKKGVLYFTLISIILLMSLSSAGLLDWFGKITGKATQQDTNATITIQGTAAVTIEVFNSTLTGSTVEPTENGIKNITFTTRITDADGAADINVSSVSANFTRTGEPLRQNTSCNDLGQDTSTAKNFSCTIGMYYFDENASWTITVRAND